MKVVVNNQRTGKKTPSRIRKLTPDEIARMRNSPMVISKREEALRVINSPQYQKHLKKRQKRRDSLIKKK